MVRLYLDIETFRKEVFANERVIAIGVLEDRTPYQEASLRDNFRIRD